MVVRFLSCFFCTALFVSGASSLLRAADEDVAPPTGSHVDRTIQKIGEPNPPHFRKVEKPEPADPVPDDSTPSDKEPILLNLSESIRMGVRGATSVLKAVNEADFSGKQLLQGYGQFLPSVSALATYSYLNGNNLFYTASPATVQAVNYGLGIQLNATLNLFNGLSDYSQLRTILGKKEALDLTVTRAKEQIAYDVTQSYLQVILDQHILEIAQNNFETSQERQSLLREQTRVGVRNLADLYRQEAQTSTDESFLINAKNQLRKDQVALLRRLRLDTNQNYTYAEPVLERPSKKDPFTDEREMVKTALTNRADLKASFSSSEAAAWNVGVARSTYFPKLDLGFNVFSTGRLFQEANVNGVDTLAAAPTNPILNQLGNFTYYSVGITLTWNLFDRFVTSQNVARASVDANNARLDFEDRRIQVVGEIRQAYGDYQGAVQQLIAAEKGLQSAEEAYNTMEGRYEVGASSFLDLSISQTALVQAQTTGIQSQIQFVLQKKLIELYLGTIKIDGKSDGKIDG